MNDNQLLNISQAAVAGEVEEWDELTESQKDRARELMEDYEVE